MVKRAVLGTLLAAGGVASAAVTDRLLIRKWAANPDSLAGQAPRFPPGRERTIPTDDGATIHTVSAGVGPSAVLVHGLSGSMDDMGPIADRLLAAGYQVIGVDQRGHGQSTVGSEGFGIARQTEDLAAVLNTLGVKDAVLIGHSMGAMVCMQLALDYPGVMVHRVGAMALIATMSDSQDWQSRAGLKLAAHRVSSAMSSLPRERLRLGAGLIGFGTRPNLTQVDHAIDATLRCNPDMRIGATEGLLDLDITDRLGEIAEPTVVISGDADRLTPLAANQVIASAIGSAELKIMEGAGHMVIWEAVDEVAETILEFAGRAVPAAALPPA